MVNDLELKALRKELEKEKERVRIIKEKDKILIELARLKPNKFKTFIKGTKVIGKGAIKTVKISGKELRKGGIQLIKLGRRLEKTPIGRSKILTTLGISKKRTSKVKSKSKKKSKRRKRK